MNPRVISQFKYDEKSGAADAILYSMFRFPESSEVHFQCDIAVCKGKNIQQQSVQFVRLALHMSHWRQCTCNVTTWRNCVTIVRMERQQCFICLCVVELRVTVNCTETLRVAQQCFYGKFILPATVERT